MVDYVLLLADGDGLVLGEDPGFEGCLDCSVNIVAGYHLHVNPYFSLQPSNNCGCIGFEHVDEADQP